MDFDTIFPAELGGSSIEEPLRALHELYNEVDAATAAFHAAVAAHVADCAARPSARTPGKRQPVSFGCPSGCGACCERFVPDILPAEADYAALWILSKRPDLAKADLRDKAPCPFYAADKPEAHCRIYGGRPLICRLFGYSAVGTKEGALAYSLCWSMPTPRGSVVRCWEGEALKEGLGAIPPLMADYGLRLQALSEPAPGDKPFIAEAVRASIDRMSLILSLARDDGGRAA